MRVFNYLGFISIMKKSTFESTGKRFVYLHKTVWFSNIQNCELDIGNIGNFCVFIPSQKQFHGRFIIASTVPNQWHERNVPGSSDIFGQFCPSFLWYNSRVCGKGSVVILCQCYCWFGTIPSGKFYIPSYILSGLEPHSKWPGCIHSKRLLLCIVLHQTFMVNTLTFQKKYSKVLLSGPKINSVTYQS